MFRKREKDVEWLEFESLQELTHGVFLRHGGISPPPFDSLNMSYQVGDSESNVDSNWNTVKQTIGLENLKACNQTHSCNVISVNHQSRQETDNCDGLITNELGLGLLIRHADCQAAIFYDPVRKVVANVHAGWRGNVVNIYQETVDRMKAEFHCLPSDLLVGVSPSLGPCHAEFVNYKEEFPRSFWTFQDKPNHFNLWKIAEKQLMDAGIKSIEFAELCTVENADDFFSYRRERTTGRLGTVAALPNS